MPVRLATAVDAAAIAAIYAPYVRDTAASFEREPPTAEEMARRLADLAPTHPWLVAEESGTISGYAYATRHRPRAAYQWCTEVSVYVRPAAQRAGTGRRLYAMLLALLRLQGFVNAYAAITLPNPASVAFHESLGFRRFAVFKRIGHKHGAWHDVGWYEAALGSHGTAPEPPLSMAALRELPGARQLLEREAGS